MTRHFFRQNAKKKDNKDIGLDKSIFDPGKYTKQKMNESETAGFLVWVLPKVFLGEKNLKRLNTLKYT